jgi:hypothetical protein
MATSDYLSSADLKGLPFGGYVNEDVMQQIIDISKISLPFTDSISSDGVKNSYTEWSKDILAAPDLTNSAVDGEDVTTYAAGTGTRVGNQCQISKKAIAVTTRARQSDTIGASDEYSRQLMRKTDELRRDVEAISLSNQTSQADDGDTAPGLAGGFNAWLTTNAVRGATGADGGFSAGTVTGATLGTVRALSETLIRDVCQSIYEQGGDPSVLMARPEVIRRISEYMFTDTARIGIQQTETGKGGASTAVGAVKVFITDFDVELVMRANRLMPAMDEPTTSLNDSVYIFDPQYWRLGYLHSYRTEPLAKTGLADKAQVAVDWTLKCLSEESAGVVADVDATTAMVA